MVALVLALGLFIEYNPSLRQYVFPPLFLSMLYASLALLDFYSEYTSLSLYRRIHVRNAFFIASVWGYVWLFVVLIVRILALQQ